MYGSFSSALGNFRPLVGKSPCTNLQCFAQFQTVRRVTTSLRIVTGERLPLCPLSLARLSTYPCNSTRSIASTDFDFPKYFSRDFSWTFIVPIVVPSRL